MEWQELIRYGDGVATVAGLVTGGLSRRSLACRVRGGQWQRILPGVVVAHSGPVSEAQRYRAALAYGGPDTLLSHQTAGALLGLRVTSAAVNITVPHGRRRANAEFVTVHQSRRQSGWLLRSGVRCTAVARAVVDIASELRRADDVVALVSDSVQRRLTSIADLEYELAQAPRRGSLLTAMALAEVVSGARSAGEAAFLRLVRKARIPEPELNARVETAGGRYSVDLLWREYGVAVEIDGMEWHLNAAAWRHDLVRQNHLHAAGIVVLRFPATRSSTDPAGVISELLATLEARGLHLP